MGPVFKELGISVLATLVLAAILGGLYPAIVWGAARLFPNRADGSLIVENGQLTGSELIGQSFSSDQYFTSRPSSAGTGYDAQNSGGSNLGPLSQKLLDGIRDRALSYRRQNGLGPQDLVPADAVLSSGSGLDPHISVRNAELQIPRVARTRGLREPAVRHLVDEYTEVRDLGLLGEPRVNVLLLNLALDRYPGVRRKKGGTGRWRGSFGD
jgi:K+-transporting ATPase ATPase C chain